MTCSSAWTTWCSGRAGGDEGKVVTGVKSGQPQFRKRVCNVREPDPLVRPRAEYLALGAGSSPACVPYRALFANALSNERLLEIRAYVQQQKALGGARFQSQIEAALGRHVQIRPAHRPRLKRIDPPENGL